MTPSTPANAGNARHHYDDKYDRNHDDYSYKSAMTCKYIFKTVMYLQFLWLLGKQKVRVIFLQKIELA